MTRGPLSPGDDFAEIIVGHTDDGHVDHVAVKSQHVLDLLRVHIDSARADDERLAVGQEQVAVLVDPSQVARLFHVDWYGCWTARVSSGAVK